MFRRIVCRIIAALFLLSYLPCHSLAVNTSAGSAILIEQNSGRVLYEHDADEQRLIASITKIMTAVVAIEYGDLEVLYTATENDMAEGSSMYLRVGETLSLEQLLYGLMLASGNDAALAVAHCVSGDLEDFTELMNKTAAALGMSRSNFVNPNGLDAEGHYSTARDMAILSAHALKNETFLRIVSTSSVTIGDRFLQNHNKLLRIYDGCLGVKTGYTKAAGRTLVSAVMREGMTLVCVTLNDGDDWNDHMSLFDYGFQSYEQTTTVRAGQKLASAVVFGGSCGIAMLAPEDDLNYPVGENEKLTLKIVAPASIRAPIKRGRVYGTVYVCLNGVEVASSNLIAMEDVDQEESEKSDGFIRRLLD